MGDKMKLYINTVKYLKPSQVCYRLLNKMKREVYKKKVIRVYIPNDLNINDKKEYLIPELDFDLEYLNRFDTEDILNGRFTFINISNHVNLANAWNNKELQHLWRYNLHYFEYLFRLAYEYSLDDCNDQYYEKFKYFVENWIDNNDFAYGDGWHSYTISLRLSNWISVYQIFKNKIKNDPNFNKRIRESIYLQYKYLQNNLEKDVLGNHYFENIKALIIGSIFLDDIKLKDKFKKELLKQLKEQILEDGMHFELSPMYHKIILEDLIKITYWLKGESIYNQLIIYIQKMMDVTYSLEESFGKTPAFNDSSDGISKSYKTLLNVCKKYFNLQPKFKNRFEDSGFYIIEDQIKKIIFDTGDICPSYLPAHGHCDALSFELSVNNLPLIVNSGTYKYEYGEWRNYFRSTKAHNTVTVSNQEQSQFWGSFRVAERIKKVRRKEFTYKGITFYFGYYVSYLGVEHKRYVGCIDEYKIIILDYVKAPLKESIISRLHFAPKTEINNCDYTVNIVLGKESIKLTPIGVSRINIEKDWYSEEFNIKEENYVVTFEKDNSKEFFGYLIDIGSTNYEINESGNELKIITDEEIIINYDELGDML